MPIFRRQHFLLAAAKSALNSQMSCFADFLSSALDGLTAQLFWGVTSYKWARRCQCKDRIHLFQSRAFSAQPRLASVWRLTHFARLIFLSLEHVTNTRVVLRPHACHVLSQCRYFLSVRQQLSRIVPVRFVHAQHRHREHRNLHNSGENVIITSTIQTKTTTNSAYLMTLP